MADQIDPLVEERLYIGGVLRSAEGGKVFDNVSPVTEQVIGVCADASGRDMEDAIVAARVAFDEESWWRDHDLRARCLRQLHAALERHAPEIKETIRAEVGATEGSLHGVQFDTSIKHLLYAADLVERYEWEKDLGLSDFLGIPTRRILRREAAGVAACITPWNAPMQVNLAKLSAALGAGCTAILKPAPDTPWTATALARLAAEETDVPAGVLNVVPTSDNAVAQMLAEDLRVDVVSFTGSTAVGRHLMAVAAPTVKNVFLELGGKSACIVCDDAPLDEVAMIAAFGSCAQAGQGCSINTRLLVQRRVYTEMVEKVKGAFESVVYGDPADPAVYMGPLINRRQHERVLSYIELGQSEGARLVTGGHRPPAMKTGYFVEPTIFADVDPRSRLAQEEIFGPVLCIIPFDDDDEAVEIANGTIYGLAAQVESRSLDRAEAIAHRLRAGNVNVNGGLYHAPDSPFGGYKQSGIGREMGVLGFDEYTEVKLLAYGQREGAGQQ
jgi:aldehyde dehydrogenase (NAD+)